MAEAQESSSPRCLLLLAGGLQAACQAVSAERFCLLALASRLPTEHVSGLFRINVDIGLVGERRVGLYCYYSIELNTHHLLFIDRKINNGSIF